MAVVALKLWFFYSFFEKFYTIGCNVKKTPVTKDFKRNTLYIYIIFKYYVINLHGIFELVGQSISHIMNERNSTKLSILQSEKCTK